MKTTSFKVLLATAFVLLFAILPSRLQSQVNNPYDVNNTLACDVNITYECFDSLCNPIPGSTTNVTLSSGLTSLTLPAGTYDIFITINWINSPLFPTYSAAPGGVLCTGHFAVPFIDSSTCGGYEMIMSVLGADIR